MRKKVQLGVEIITVYVNQQKICGNRIIFAVYE